MKRVGLSRWANINSADCVIENLGLEITLLDALISELLRHLFHLADRQILVQLGSVLSFLLTGLLPVHSQQPLDAPFQLEHGLLACPPQRLLHLLQGLFYLVFNEGWNILILGLRLFRSVIGRIGYSDRVGVWGLGGGCPASLDGLEEVFLALLEGGVAEADGILAFADFVKAVHVELSKPEGTCLRKDL